MPMNKIIVALMVAFFLGSCCSFVAAAPPVTTVQQFVEGYAIIDTPQINLVQNHNFQYNLFLYNLSNGVLLDNSSSRICVFYLADPYGEVIFYSNVSYFSDGHWGLDVNGDNFSRIGEYAYGTKCQGTGFGGSVSGLWHVSPTGWDLSQAQTYIYLAGFVLLIMFALFFFTLGIIFKHPGTKIFLMALAGLTMIFLLGLVLASMNDYLAFFTSALSLFNTYYIFITIIATGAGIGLVVWLIYYAVTLFSKTRGRYSEDD
jgi:hypothetical protein